MLGSDSSTLDETIRSLPAQLPAMERALAALVDENSFTSHVAGGNRVGAQLRALIAPTGLACEVIKSERFADHLVFSGKAAGTPVVLVGHLDTVFPPGSFEGYARDGDLARGPGVLDMKGGLVVVGFALRALAEAGVLQRLPVRFVIVSDEEVGSPEGQGILRAHAGSADAGLVFEAGRTGDAIVTRRKGTGSLVATAQGKSAHAGNLHHEGINAIWALARFIDKAQSLTDYPAGTTVNVGKVEGGQARNTVPEAARAEIDIRFVARAAGAALIERLRACADEAACSVPGSAVALSGGISRDPLELSPASERLFEAYAACALASGLGGSQAPMVGGGSDANTLSALGVPSIDGLGPRGWGFHTREERIVLSSLVPKTEALLRFLWERVVAG